MLRDLRRCLRLFDRATLRRALWLLPLTLAVPLLEVAGAALIFFFVQLLDGSPPVEQPGLLGALRGGGDPASGLRRLGLATAGLYLLKTGVLFVETHAGLAWVHRGVNQLSARLLGAYLDADYAQLLRRDSAELIDTTHHQVETAFRGTVVSARLALTEGLVAAAMLAVLAASAPGVALGVTALMAALAGLLLSSTHRRLGAQADRISVLNRRVFRALHDIYSGVREVRLYGREQRFAARFNAARGQLSSELTWRGDLEGAPRLLVEAVFVVGVVLLALVLAPRAAAVTPLFALFAYAGLRMLPSFHRVLQHVSRIRYGRQAVEEVLGELEALQGAPGSIASDEEEALPLGQALAAEGVSYVYPRTSRPVLSGVTLRVARGEYLGVVGPTGAGKSTLVDLLLGLLRATEGRVTLDGIELGERARAFRRRVGYVSQVPWLLDASIAANVAFELEAGDIDTARVWRALDQAQLAGMVRGLDEGLETVVGERGVRLSGGERQRLAIARALYREPDLLVLDEATSALDAQTEQAIADVIEPLRGQRTILIVAHRVRTLERCDRLVFLLDGRVAGTGTFRELRERSPEFRAMVDPTEGAAAAGQGIPRR